MNKAIYDGYVVKLPNSQGDLEEIGGWDASGNLDRLVTAGAFVYITEAGRVSVRLESKSRGPLLGYWSAYKRIGGRLHKTYVAAVFALDPYNLEEAALRLLELAGEKLPNTRPPLCQIILGRGTPHA
jgi:hypothetical protein